MRSGRLHARLDRLAPPATLRRIVVIHPEDWSVDAQVAYDAAALAGDTERQEAIILQETGEVVNFGDGSVIKVIEIRTADYGPV